LSPPRASFADPATAQVAPSQALPSGSVAPVAAGTPQAPPNTIRVTRSLRACSSFLPAGVTVPDNAAPTLYSFTITLKGEQSDPTLYRSSGYGDLDNAALACVRNNRAFASAPSTSAGRPVESTWVAGFFWGHRPPTFAFANPNGGPNLCDHRYPRIAMRRRIEGSTSIAYRIGVDGNVKDMTVTQSSGSSVLDNAAMDCVKAWQYFPVTQHGQPVEVDKFLTMNWRM
jgi:TonB family protein